VNAAELTLVGIAVYLACGLLVAAPFVLGGVGRVDPVARHAPLSFRIVIIPGCAALWPWVLTRWARAGREDPQ
jgi:hypothetical protein